MKVEVVHLEHVRGDWWRLQLADGQTMLLLESTLATLKVTVGHSLTPDQVHSIKRQSEVDAAHVAALRLLSYRPRSVAELRRRLAEKGHAEYAIAAVVRRLREQRLLDDVSFAESWVRDVLARRPVGRARLWHELRQKGVSPEVAAGAIDAALERIAARVTADDAEAVLAGEALRARLAKANFRKTGVNEAKQRRRLVAFLRRRGFDWPAITAAFRACGLERFG